MKINRASSTTFSSHLKLGSLFASLFFSMSFSLATENYPKLKSQYPAKVYWGDTHLHTNFSVDSYSVGNRIFSPEAAYRFARGGEVNGFNGIPVKLSRPLDFLVIADHAENMGMMPALEVQDPILLSTEMGRQWSLRLQGVLPKLLKSKEYGSQATGDNIFIEALRNRIVTDEFQRSVWNKAAEMADKHNSPGIFTAFIGYEWTPSTLIHRVVIFEDDAGKVTQRLPFTQFDSREPEDLWASLEDYQKETGGDALAIPHNANLSRGRMFFTEDSQARPFSTVYAKTRSRWEPLLEVTQKKGNSEAHPQLSPTDEFANYEIMSRKEISEKESVELKYSYARSALKIGLEQQALLGINPFNFGMIGSTDSHTSLSAAEDRNVWAAWPIKPDNFTKTFKPSNVARWEFSGSGGYAAVWAEENTRQSLFAAMKRKETYATTGSRISLRFFGGWGYDSNDAFRPDLAKIGYRNGVPMGGDLTRAPQDKAPSFLIRAVKDPEGANLDRVQVIKGWRDKRGELHEKIYNVALSDNRKEGKDGKVTAVDSSVNIQEASYLNSIGDPELAVVWADPDFNRNEFAFYYVRVLEIPTPRWTAYSANFFGVKDIPDEVLMVTQERAYTSPIWYSPSVKPEERRW